MHSQRYVEGLCLEPRFQLGPAREREAQLHLVSGFQFTSSETPLTDE
jgi:hypothetical protein